MLLTGVASGAVAGLRGAGVGAFCGNVLLSSSLAQGRLSYLTFGAGVAGGRPKRTMSQ